MWQIQTGPGSPLSTMRRVHTGNGPPLSVPTELRGVLEPQIFFLVFVLWLSCIGDLHHCHAVEIRSRADAPFKYIGHRYYFRVVLGHRNEHGHRAIFRLPLLPDVQGLHDPGILRENACEGG